jgi:hypothetical protein
VKNCNWSGTLNMSDPAKPVEVLLYSGPLLLKFYPSSSTVECLIATPFTTSKKQKGKECCGVAYVALCGTILWPTGETPWNRHTHVRTGQPIRRLGAPRTQLAGASNGRSPVTPKKKRSPIPGEWTRSLGLGASFSSTRSVSRYRPPPSQHCDIGDEY